MPLAAGKLLLRMRTFAGTETENKPKQQLPKLVVNNQQQGRKQQRQQHAAVELKPPPASAPVVVVAEQMNNMNNNTMAKTTNGFVVTAANGNRQNHATATKNGSAVVVGGREGNRKNQPAAASEKTDSSLPPAPPPRQYYAYGHGGGAAAARVPRSLSEQRSLEKRGRRKNSPPQKAVPTKTDAVNVGRPLLILGREEKESERRRPAVIKEDLVQMGRRKRVQEVLDSEDFCAELNNIMFKSYSEDLNRLNEPLPQLFVPPGQMPFVNLRFATSHTAPLSAAAVVPIDDIPRNSKWSREERASRCRLASMYRLADLFQWSQGIYNHITLRLPRAVESNTATSRLLQQEAEVLINPFGLLYNEITASSLIKISLAGEVLDPGSTNLGINQAGYVLHSAIHEAREDVHCVLHLHTAVVAAVSSMKCGLLPLCQEALIIGPVAYHDYKGIVSDEEEKRSIVEDLGDRNVMLLRNHGFVTCGRTVEDALHLAFHTVIACETQIRATRVGLDNLLIPSKEAAHKAYTTARQGGGGVNKTGAEETSSWGIGELEWEAWMRILDASGYKTGHNYRHPALRSYTSAGGGGAKSRSMYNLSNVALPPAVTPSFGSSIDGGEGAGVPPHRIAMLRREEERARWISSNGNYQRIRFYETGTDHPRMFTKWVQDNVVNTGSVRLENPQSQFTPLGTDPQEFREKRQQMKDRRAIGLNSSGPHSQVLQQEAGVTQYFDGIGQQQQRAVRIGTASKGIIDREYQHNADVYRQLYAPNPFSSAASEEDLKQYLRDLEEFKSKSITSQLDKAPLAAPETPTTNGAAASNGQQQNSEVVQQTNSSSPLNNKNGMPQTPPKPTAGGDQENVNPKVAVEENLRTKKKLKRFFSFGRKKTIDSTK